MAGVAVKVRPREEDQAAKREEDSDGKEAVAGAVVGMAAGTIVTVKFLKGKFSNNKGASNPQTNVDPSKNLNK